MNYIQYSTTESIETFKSAMRNAGLTPPHIIKPGELHRFPGKGKNQSNKAGWCILFEDLKGGVFGDHSSEFKGNWQLNGGKEHSVEEHEVFMKRCEAERKQRDMEQQQRHEAAASNAAEILNAATADPVQHPYAIKKRVSLGEFIKRGSWVQRGWNDALLVPLYNAQGKITTISAINVDGEKNYLKDGFKKGSFHPFGKVRGANRILIGEGIATVAAAHEATNTPAAAAMDSGNLEAVALAMRELAPNAEIVLLADNDIKPDGSNIGLKAAHEAAQAVLGYVTIPELDGAACDFWDLWDKKGIEAVRNTVDKTIKATVPLLDEYEPEPLRATLSQTKPYPANELGSIMSKAVQALHEEIQAPLAMCAQSVLAGASYAVQAHFDVVLPWNGQQAPCTLFFLTVGESGSRKSSVDSVVLSRIKAKEKNDYEQYRQKIKVYEKERAAWQEAVICMRKKATQGKALVTGEQLLEIQSACGKEPELPIMPICIVTDPTIEGLYKMLERNQPNVALFSDEGGLLIGGHALSKENVLKTLSRWAKLWDGASFDRVRSQDGTGMLYGRRMALHQLAQPRVMDILLSNDIADDQGFLPRCLVAWPDSLIGKRFITAYGRPQDRPEVNAYLQIIDTLISHPPVTATEDKQQLQPKPLRLSAEANRLSIEIYNQFEGLMNEGQDLEHLRAKCARAMEQTCRIAAVLAVIELGLSVTEIGRQHIEQASILVQWYLAESKRIREVSAIQPEIKDAEKLLKWLHVEKIKVFRSAQVFNGGKIRDKKQLERAITELVKHGYIVENPPNTEVEGVRARRSWTVLHYYVV